MRRRTRSVLALLFIPVLVAAGIGEIPIPKVIHSDKGDIPIIWVPKIMCGTVDARGCYSSDRKVWIITGMSHDSTLQTIRHEQCHASLRDAEIEIDSITHTGRSWLDYGTAEDDVCDALAWAWLHEKQHGH